MSKALVWIIAVVLAGCALPPRGSANSRSEMPRIKASIVVGKVRIIDFSGLTGTTPLVIIGNAYVTILEPSSLSGRELVIESSEDFPFAIGDEIEIDFSSFGIDQSSDGRLRTTMLFDLPLKIRPNKALVPTTASVTPAADAPVAPAAAAAHL